MEGAVSYVQPNKVLDVLKQFSGEFATPYAVSRDNSFIRHIRRRQQKNSLLLDTRGLVTYAIRALAMFCIDRIDHVQSLSGSPGC